jgi:hypothetical protein
MVNARPAPISATIPANTRSLSRERDAPPNPVCGAPDGMAPTVPTRPVDPPAPGADPVRPVTPEPVGVAPVAPGVAVVPAPPVPLDGAGVVVVVVRAGTKLLMNAVMQVTALPPPVAVSLHWLTVTGKADVPPVTVQPTVVSPRNVPPPVPEPLHWVTVAFVVLPIGAQISVLPPPPADPMH